MRILIVDDEPLARDRLRHLLSEMPNVEIVGEAGDGRGALELCARLHPDLVLLDIRMPGMDGLEAARHLVQLGDAPAIVFTTAYGDYALQAFEAQAVDYLLKPIRSERLAQALSRARRLSGARLNAVRAASERQQGRSHLAYTLHGNLHLLPVAEVIFLRAEDKYVVAYHARGEALLEESLVGLENEFPQRFVRIHRNALVARAALAGLEKEADGSVRLRVDGRSERLEVSRRQLPEVRKLLRAGTLPS